MPELSNKTVSSKNFINIVLFQPEIPHNTGAIGRLAIGANARLHLVKPFGFVLDDKAIRRAGLDYWQYVDLHIWENWQQLIQQELKENPAAKFWMFTTKTSRPYWEAPFRCGDFLVFGPESRGIPEPMLDDYAETSLTIPMFSPHARSLNLATAVAIGLYKATEQIHN